MTISAPAASSTSAALRTWCPVVETSSIRATVGPRPAIPFDLRLRPVLLRLLADDRDRKAGLEGDGRDEKHRSALGRAERRDTVGQEQRCRGLRHVAEQSRVGEEPELVEVDRRSPSAREDEVSVQLRRGHHPSHEVVVHRAASIRTWVEGVVRSRRPPGVLRPPSRGLASPRDHPAGAPAPVGADRRSRPRSVAARSTLCGIRLANPVGLAAGFDKTCRHLDALGRLGFGFVVGGTITRRPRQGNPKPQDRPFASARRDRERDGAAESGRRRRGAALARARRTAPRFASVADEDVDDGERDRRRSSPPTSTGSS